MILLMPSALPHLMGIPRLRHKQVIHLVLQGSMQLLEMPNVLHVLQELMLLPQEQVLVRMYLPVRIRTKLVEQPRLVNAKQVLILQPRQ